MSKTRVIIVGESVLFRDLLRATLSQYEQLYVVGDFRDGESVLAQQLRPEPEVAVIDVDVHRGTRAVQAARVLCDHWPDLKVVLLADLSYPALLPSPSGNDRPGWSYLLKSSRNGLASLLRTIESAASGLLVVDPDIAAPAGGQAPDIRARLTSRQLEIVELIARGYHNAEIARQLGIARKTVENQINALYHHLGLDRRESPFHPRVRAALLYLHAAPAD